MPWWGWLIISVLSLTVIGLLCFIGRFITGLEREFRRAFM